MDWKFSEADLKQIERLGLSRGDLLRQESLHRKGVEPLSLLRPCTVGDGVRRLTPEEWTDLLSEQQVAQAEGRFQKFVPASGAATRMFADWVAYQKRRDSTGQTSRADDAAIDDFFSSLERFAFYPELISRCVEQGLKLEEGMEVGGRELILRQILDPQGLNFPALPKGMIPFHLYADHTRNAFEEHLVEAIEYCADARGDCRVHFTVAEEHFQQVKDFLEKATQRFARSQYRFLWDLSLQSPTTHTLAVDLYGQPVRKESGELLFRPGGHGALLKNLQECGGDLVFIKNIDNVAPDRLKGPGYRAKRLLGGLCLRLQGRLFEYLRFLEEAASEHLLEDAADFAHREFYLDLEPLERLDDFSQRRQWLVEQLHRPIRVCGVVPYNGEPGGGPFWVADAGESLSLQIVEKSQIRGADAEQIRLFAASTHFNPVDMVCGLRDFRGDCFDLQKFVDASRWFLSKKSYRGEEIAVLERPGLWNGAMAHWLTVFVEIPQESFTPVKTLADLLRPEHQDDSGD